jgi:hypothetical protein
MLDHEGAAGPADVSLIGDEGVLGPKLDRLRDLGVTDFVASVVTTDREANKRTLEFLASRTAMAAAQ